MDYFEFSFSLSPRDPYTGILTAQLAELGFETFAETEEGVKAYIPSKAFTDELLGKADVLKNPALHYTFSKELIRQQNWNEEWEKNFQPVEIPGKLRIRAPFHAPASNQTSLEIVIEPRMSFGTGHHDTTCLMAEELFEVDVKGKRVLDMGCGTGILAIVAAKLGAGEVLAIDIEEWACGNAKDNAQHNEIFNIHVEKGDVNSLAGRTFQLILANINKNVLLGHLPAYSAGLTRGGELLISGFFESDSGELAQAARAHGLLIKNTKVRNGWAMLHFSKEIL